MNVTNSVLVNSYYHRGGQQPLLGITIAQQFFAIVEKYPNQEALVSVPQKQRITYRNLAQKVKELSRGLIGLGYRKGDRIGIWSTNNSEWLILQLATATIGVVLVNINPAYRLRELSYALKQSNVQGLFFIASFRSSNYVEMLAQIIPEIKHDSTSLHNKDFPQLRRIVLYDPKNGEADHRPYPGISLWTDIIEAGHNISNKDVDGTLLTLEFDDAINIQYTSGTTGFPKAVVLSHHNILNNAYFSALAMRFTHKDRLCVPVPFYHCFGMVLSNLMCLCIGACIVIPSEYFDPHAVLKALASEKCTAIHGVPTMFISELEHPEFSLYDLTNLRTGIMAGAPCPPVLMTRVMQEMHCREILIGYGQTEASPITHLTVADDSMEHRTETVGKNLPHQEVKIVNPENGKIVTLNTTGEICFRGYHIMKGYYSDLKATKNAIDENGWLHSGDLGSMDHDGYVRITGRLKDMIIRGGENIYPREIEDLIFTHAKVAEVAVFGIPDDYYGEELMAWILLHEGQVCDENEIRSFCKDKIAHFKIPKYIWFVSEFPMTVTGKLQKFRMREIAVEKFSQA